MKKGHYAVYKGKEYKAYLGKSDSVIIEAENEGDAVSGFILDHHGTFVKHLVRKDLEKVYSIAPMAMYRGTKFGIAREDGDKILIFTGGDYSLIEKLNLTFVEADVYEKWVRKDELEKVWEEKFSLPLDVYPKNGS